jgi:hypothetical protein
VKYQTATNEDIANSLTNDYGIPPEHFEGMSKSKMWSMLKGLENGSAIGPSFENGTAQSTEEPPFDTSESELDNIDFGDGEDTGDFVVNTNEEVEVDEDVEVTPMLGSPAWHDYVMSKFVKDELFNGNPTVDGMRRVVEQVVCPIKSITTNIIQLPNQLMRGEVGDRRATAVVRVALQDNTMFEGAADSYWANTDDKAYVNYPVSMAETRAEGRALKKALRLRRVNAVEELGKTVDHSEENVELGNITPQQLNFLSIMCGTDRTNVNINKLLEQMGLPSATKLTHKQAIMVNEKLNELQQSGVPEELKGYDANWQN